MKVLFVFHTGRVSGAERSAMELMRRLPSTGMVYAACPDGDLAVRLQGMGIETFAIPEAAPSRRLHWWRTPVDVLSLCRAGARLRRIARTTRPDVVHATSLRAGVISAAIPRRLHAALVVDIRDALPPGRAARVVKAITVRRAAAFIANSAWTREAFGPLPTRARMVVVHPPVDLNRFAAGSRAIGRRAVGVPDDRPLLGIVGQITPWKGHDDALRILAQVREQVPDAELLIVGTAVFAGSGDSLDSASFSNSLPGLARRLGIADAVQMLGSREDVPNLMAALDCLLVPSWAEPFGRVVLEGIAAGVPVVATARGGPAELAHVGASLTLLPPRDPDGWAPVIASMLAPGPQASLPVADLAAMQPEAAVERITRLYDALLKCGAR